jgi:lysophospholipase L1-like esterase
MLMLHSGSAQPAPKKFLALGDSYTIGEAVAEHERWPNQLVEALQAKGIVFEKPRIIATTGWRTDNLMDAVQAADLKNEYALVSLLVGVNNQYQHKPLDAYRTDFAHLLERAVQLAQGKRENVFVVSIPDYGYTPFGKAKQPEISAAIDLFNEANRAMAAGQGIRYVDVTGISREGLSRPEYVAPDGLHPSGEMYRRWVELMLKVF